jgi:hypothetical protein
MERPVWVGHWRGGESIVSFARLSLVTNLKPFDPNDIDETLTRVVTHGGATHLLFPYINATGKAPTFNSINCVIDGPTATIEDFAALSALIEQGREPGEWFLSFNTPWLMTASEGKNIRQRGPDLRSKRD